MRRCPAIYDICTLSKVIEGNQAGLPDGRWVPARPYGGHWRWSRLRATWLVFTGRADALTWPGQS